MYSTIRSSAIVIALSFTAISTAQSAAYMKLGDIKGESVSSTQKPGKQLLKRVTNKAARAKIDSESLKKHRTADKLNSKEPASGKGMNTN
jgi:hypothetical protein